MSYKRGERGRLIHLGALSLAANIFVETIRRSYSNSFIRDFDSETFVVLKYTRRHLILEVFRFFIFFKKFLYFLLTMLTTYAWVDRILFLVENVSNALTCRLRFHWITRHSESNLQVKIFWLLTWLATTIVSLNLKF